MSRADDLPLPPECHAADGSMRRLGVELEFSGIDIDTASALVTGEFGGSIDEVSDYEHRVRGTELGDFNVELDFEYLKSLGREEGRSVDEDWLLDRLPEWVIAEIARHVVPLEVVSPPVPMDRLGRLDILTGKLRDAGALGTRQSPIYAFGLHLNPEVPALDAGTIVAYLRAFLCLYDWLVKAGEVDWSRRVTPYINPFPAEYVLGVVAPDYAPALDELVDDYLASNADRNRALDMLPLFAYLDEDRVRATVDDARIKARPTLHYRLANCDIDRPGWGVHNVWRDWMEVEHLAHDRERLARVATAYHEHLRQFTSRALGNWAQTCEQWLSSSGR